MGLFALVILSIANNLFGEMTSFSSKYRKQNFHVYDLLFMTLRREEQDENV